MAGYHDPTAQTNVTEAAKTAGHAAMMGEREKNEEVWKQNGGWTGHGEADQH